MHQRFCQKLRKYVYVEVFMPPLSLICEDVLLFFPKETLTTKLPQRITKVNYIRTTPQ